MAVVRKSSLRPGVNSVRKNRMELSWRCKNGDFKFCPPEGCPKSYGCAREKGWKLGDPSPNGVKGIETPEKEQDSVK